MRFPTVVTAGQITDLVGGRLIGRTEVEVAGIAPLDRAGPGDLSFVVSERFLDAFRTTEARAILVPEALADLQGADSRIVVSEPLLALARILEHFAPPRPTPWGVHPTARIGRGTRWSGRVAIGPDVQLGKNVLLGSACVIGSRAIVGDGVRIGDGCLIEGQTTVFEGVRLGSRVVIRSGARVGGPGFGFVQTQGGHERLPQVGQCIVADDVEIGANTTVDRGSLGDTQVGAGTKIDNLVQIAHNVRVGRRCVILAQVGVAGSTVVEDDVMLAGQAGLADHLTVGHGARVAAQSGVIGDIPPGATVSGYPARDHRSVLRQSAALARLAPLVTSLERMLKPHE